MQYIKAEIMPKGLRLLGVVVHGAMRGAGAPCRGLPIGERPQVEADWAALSAALMSACGSGAHTYPRAHGLAAWSSVVLVTLQVTTSCMPFMPFCISTLLCEAPASTAQQDRH